MSTPIYGTGGQRPDTASGAAVRWWEPHHGWRYGTVKEVYSAQTDWLTRAVVTFGAGDARILPLTGLQPDMRLPEWVRRAQAGTLPVKVDMRRYERH